MSGTTNGPEGSNRRWWEIRGGREPDEERYADLVTGGQGRSRPERSLSAGADPADDPHRPLRGLLWPVVSVVAAGALILFVVYGAPKGMFTSSGNTTSPVTAASGSAQGTAGGQPLTPPALPGNLPGVGGALPPLGGAAGIPGGGSGGNSGGSAGGSGGDQGNQPTGTPTAGSSTSLPVPRVTVGGPAPAAPAAQQNGTPVPGTGGCTGIAGSSGYACTLTQNAPVYLAGTTDPRGGLPADQYPFLCQSDGSPYSVGNRANHWWAWVGNTAGAWVPVVFLAGGPNDGPEPGLPVCGSAPAPTPTPTPTANAPHSGQPPTPSTGQPVPSAGQPTPSAS